MMEQQASNANNLAAAKTGEQNALTDIVNMFSGYNSPSPLEVG